MTSNAMCEAADQESNQDTQRQDDWSEEGTKRLVISRGKEMQRKCQDWCVEAHEDSSYTPMVNRGSRYCTFCGPTQAELRWMSEVDSGRYLEVL